MFGPVIRSGGPSAAPGLPIPRVDFRPDASYFTSPKNPFGREALDLAVGPIRMRLQGLSGGQTTVLRSRFRPFIPEDGADPVVTIRLSRAAVEGFLRLRDDRAPEIYRMESRLCGGRLTLWSYEFAGWLEAAGGAAGLDLVQEEGTLFDRGLENFLRVLSASFVLHQGGFLLHGSGVVRGGKAYIFFGPSGAGKTTVTRLSPRDTILSDDLTLVVRREGGTYAAAGIPFGLAHHRVPETSAAFPIASLNRLVQSRTVRRDRLSTAQAVADVAASLPFVMQETGQATLAMATVGESLETIPVYRLEFREDDSFWKVVEEQRGEGVPVAGC